MLEIYTPGLLVGSLAIAVSACAGYAQCDLGTVDSGVGNALLDSGHGRTTATVAGSIGHSGIDKHVGRQDRATMAHTFEATPTGETTAGATRPRGSAMPPPRNGPTTPGTTNTPVANSL